MSVRYVEHDGRKQTISAWAREHGIKPVTLRARISRYGMSMADALSKTVTLENIKWYRVKQARGRRKYEHQLIAERALGKPLPEHAVIHHVNGDRHDNRTCNLVICNSHAHHMAIHYRQDALRESGDANNLKCDYCKQWDSPENVREIACTNGRKRRYHAKCNTESQRRYRKRRKL